MNRRNFFAGLFGMAAVAAAPKVEAKLEHQPKNAFDKENWERIEAILPTPPELPPYVVEMKRKMERMPSPSAKDIRRWVRHNHGCSIEYLARKDDVMMVEVQGSIDYVNRWRRINRSDVDHQEIAKIVNKMLDNLDKRLDPLIANAKRTKSTWCHGINEGERKL